MSRRILLVGYYGKANFGDDVLLVTSYRILKQAIPEAQISVIIDGDVGDYVTTMLGEVSVLKPGRHGSFDYIVHGGGGVYFDFKAHGLRARLIEKCVLFLGFPVYLALEKNIRRILDKSRTSAPIRLGMGIGVGTYTPGSPRLRASLPILVDYNALWVRDAESIANLKRVQSIISGEIIRGSDLAFLTQYWLEEPVTLRTSVVRPRLGIILRDWLEELGGLSEATLRETIVSLASEYDITGFVLDHQADPQLQQLLAPYTTCIWRPEIMTITDFANKLSQQDVLLASRAHGAICGACVGVPSVIVAIEPKLQQVAKMLGDACCVVAANQPESWAEMLRRARNIAPQVIAAAVEKNRVASSTALTQIQKWLG